jgi:type IV pilus assembly protein PilB
MYILKGKFNKEIISVQASVANKTLEKLKYDLVRSNLISFEDLNKAEEISDSELKNLGQVIIDMGFIQEEVLLKFIQDNLKIPYVNLEDYSLDEKQLYLVSPDDARKYKILPLFMIEDTLTIAMADPLDLFVLNNLIKTIKCKVEPIICSERIILTFIEKYYEVRNSENTSQSYDDGILIDWREELNEDSPDISQAEKIINSIISQAFLEKYFEIILEPSSVGLNVEFKNISEISNKGSIPLLLAPLCIFYLKRISGLDTSISDIPQLGKFGYSADITYITTLVSIFPSIKGERISIKLYLPPKKLTDLSLKKDFLDIINKSFENPGLILIAGSELSGKSFFAYTILNSLDTSQKKIMTVESIVKYEILGVVQSELNEKVGFSMEKALGNIDFQFPDIIYIEEILSGKSAEIIFSLVKSGRIVITEVNAADTQDMLKFFSDNEREELKRLVSCVIFVKNNEIIVSLI